ncbi:stage III sporulation protein AG [Clostridium sp.]|uniref:stage III sporulation protein AG n=1 Tax=Clostridium sp. TaxID=1506 RepID=UPI0026334A0A|nr:stage III sporulation protein AG [Clostridium sp.]
MRKKDYKKEISNIINDKRFLNIVCVALILAFVLLAISFVSNSRKKSNESVKVNGTESNLDIGGERSKVLSSYEEKEMEELKGLLGKIQDVGQVEVKIHFKSGEVKVPAIENTNQEAVTEETDNQGGKRINNQKTGGSKVVMSDNGSSTEPYILQINKPEVYGVVIVASGANSSKVKYDIQVAVSNLYGISIDKVNVYPMKS